MEIKNAQLAHRYKTKYKFLKYLRTPGYEVWVNNAGGGALGAAGALAGIGASGVLALYGT